MFIKLQEYYHHCGGYLTKLLVCNKDSIISVTETNDPYKNLNGSTVVTIDGHTHYVKDKCEDILKILLEEN